MDNKPYPEEWVLMNPDGYDNKDREFDVFFDKKNNALITVQRGWSLSGQKEPTDAKD